MMPSKETTETKKKKKTCIIQNCLKQENTTEQASVSTSTV